MKEMRNLYVVYDIHDDNLRNTISNILMMYGLHRVQYSVFNGLLTATEKREMVENLKSIEYGAEDKIHIIDLCKKCVKNAISIGKKERGREHIIL
ncbi:MAG TPA: CRISPR-associated endonuclease Cas2 [Candidatus Atribacteria bacterium]|nr:CRISPR-associated endonuclease Cas2 [Candidatus Atribacteria bacterium]